MKIILVQDVHELGLEGEIVDVARGYARNYLFPKGVGVEATSENIKALDLRRKKIEVKRLKAREEAEKLKERVDGVTITFSQKAGEEGKLYGSVTTMDIAERLEAEGLVFERRKIVLDRPIKALGEYRVAVKIYPKVTAHVNVVVVPEA
jgi:large subunit ribosomal protein L9